MIENQSITGFAIFGTGLVKEIMHNNLIIVGKVGVKLKLTEQLLTFQHKSNSKFLIRVIETNDSF